MAAGDSDEAATTFWIRAPSCSFAPFTRTVELPFALLPAMSVAVQAIVVCPIANVLPEAGEQLTPCRPEPPSLAVAENVTIAPAGLVAFTVTFAGRLSVGAFRSILLPPIGPAVAQLPATSQTCRELVCAFAVSSSAGDTRREREARVRRIGET